MNLILAETYARKGMLLRKASGQAEVDAECHAAGNHVRKQGKYLGSKSKASK